jgi:hypothetical protein
MMRAFTAPGGTVFHHNAELHGRCAYRPGEPSVEVPIADLVAFVAYVVNSGAGAPRERVKAECDVDTAKAAARELTC